MMNDYLKKLGIPAGVVAFLYGFALVDLPVGKTGLEILDNYYKELPRANSQHIKTLYTVTGLESARWADSMELSNLKNQLEEKRDLRILIKASNLTPDEKSEELDRLEDRMDRLNKEIDRKLDSLKEIQSAIDDYAIALVD